MEEQLWKATWKRSGCVFWVALVEYPNVKAIGRTLEEAIEKLEDKISDELGDAVPHLEFVNPLPSSASGRFIFTLAGHSENYDVTNEDALFDRPRCPTCHNHQGERNDEPIRLCKPPQDDLMFTSWLGQIISRRLANFLRLQQCKEVILRPVVISGALSVEYLEVISVHPRPYVAKKGVKASWGAFHCKKCGGKHIMYMPHEAEFLKYIAAGSLPRKMKSVFPVGVAYEARLAVNQPIRDAVVRSKRFRNVVSYKVGVLPEGEYVSLDEYFREPPRKK